MRRVGIAQPRSTRRALSELLQDERLYPEVSVLASALACAKASLEASQP